MLKGKPVITSLPETLFLSRHSLLSIPVRVCLVNTKQFSFLFLQFQLSRSNTHMQEQISLLTLIAVERSGSCGSGTV